MNGNADRKARRPRQGYRDGGGFVKNSPGFLAVVLLKKNNNRDESMSLEADVIWIIIAENYPKCGGLVVGQHR